MSCAVQGSCAQLRQRLLLRSFVTYPSQLMGTTEDQPGYGDRQGLERHCTLAFHCYRSGPQAFKIVEPFQGQMKIATSQNNA